MGQSIGHASGQLHLHLRRFEPAESKSIVRTGHSSRVLETTTDANDDCLDPPGLISPRFTLAASEMAIESLTLTLEVIQHALTEDRDRDLKSLVLTTHEIVHDAERTFKEGASEFATNATAAEESRSAIQQFDAGQKHSSPVMTDKDSGDS